MRFIQEWCHLKELRSLKYSLIVSVLSLMLLCFIFRSDEIFKFKAVTPILKPSVQPTVPQYRTKGSTVIRGHSAQLVKVNGSKTLLISGYLEHRTKTKEVRVIAIMLRNNRVALQCHLHCRNQLHVTKTAIDIHTNHFNFPYGTADIMCPVPSSCEIPSYVAITSDTVNNKENTDLEFLVVKNQISLSSPFPYNFTCCFSVMYNFTNVLQLVQSLEVLQLLGVRRAVIYKTNCSADVQRVLDYYSAKGLVEIIPWSLSKYLNVSRRAYPSQSPGDIHYFGQIPALNDCLYRYMYQSKYVAFHDIDELILPQSVNSWLDLLLLLEKKYGADRCYKFENNIFPSEFELPLPKPATLPPLDHWKNVSGVNILAHLYREPVIPKLRYSNFKIIVNPRAVFSTSVHGVLKSKNGCVWVNREIARMYHIKPRGPSDLKPKELIYEGRLLSYSSQLIPAVNAVLRKTQLLPEDRTN